MVSSKLILDRDANNYRLVISNKDLHSLCGTSDVSEFIKQQQANYTAHVIRISNARSLKHLMFNEE